MKTYNVTCNFVETSCRSDVSRGEKVAQRFESNTRRSKNIQLRTHITYLICFIQETTIFWKCRGEENWISDMRRVSRKRRERSYWAGVFFRHLCTNVNLGGKGEIKQTLFTSSERNSSVHLLNVLRDTILILRIDDSTLYRWITARWIGPL